MTPIAGSARRVASSGEQESLDLSDVHPDVSEVQSPWPEWAAEVLAEWRKGRDGTGDVVGHLGDLAVSL